MNFYEFFTAQIELMAVLDMTADNCQGPFINFSCTGNL